MVRRVLWSICREQSTRLPMGVWGCAVQCSAVRGGIIADWNLHMIFLIRLPTSSILYNFSCSFHMWHHPVKKKKKKSQGHIFLYHTAASCYTSNLYLGHWCMAGLPWQPLVFFFPEINRAMLQRKFRLILYCMSHPRQANSLVLVINNSETAVGETWIWFLLSLWHISSSATMCDLQLSDQQRAT